MPIYGTQFATAFGYLTLPFEVIPSVYSKDTLTGTETAEQLKQLGKDICLAQMLNILYIMIGLAFSQLIFSWIKWRSFETLAGFVTDKIRKQLYINVL
jgi:hypothetical protein